MTKVLLTLSLAAVLFAGSTTTRAEEVAEITLTADKIQFIYDIKEFTVKAGQKVVEGEERARLDPDPAAGLVGIFDAVEPQRADVGGKLFLPRLYRQMAAPGGGGGLCFGLRLRAGAHRRRPGTAAGSICCCPA